MSVLSPCLLLAAAAHPDTNGVSGGIPSRTLLVKLETLIFVPFQCSALVAGGLKSQVYFPNTSNYEAREGSYWSANARLSPSCIVQPRNTNEVSAAISILSQAPGNFAVRSGGHSHWAGGSNIHVGVTIDLGLLNSVVYNKDTGLAELGPGSKWGSVYHTLQAQGVGVAGGRDANVGVGGFLTGGGNSYYSGLMGLGCDTVRSAEVVLANGTILTTSADSHPDLLRAIKGGTGNFCIVTRFDVATFPYQDLWGGLMVTNRTYAKERIASMAAFTDSNEHNREDAYIINFTYNPASFDEVVISSVVADVNGVERAPAFHDALAIPTIFTDLKKRSMANMAETYVLPAGTHNIWFSRTFRNDQLLMQHAATINEYCVNSLRRALGTNSFTLQSLFQPIPRYFADIANHNGGNVLGLERFENNALLWLLTGAFQSAEHEQIAYPILQSFYTALQSHANALSANLPWEYLNYADPSQNPLASYGEQNVEFMREVSAKYDPAQVFQKKSPAGFKLSAIPKNRVRAARATVHGNKRVGW